MRTHKNFAIAAVFALVVLTGAQSAMAQSQALRANIPFDFYVAGTLMPAGTYTISPSSWGEAIRVWDKNSNSAFVMTTGLTPNHATEMNRLVFRRYGTTSFLAKVYWIGFPSGKEIATSAMEQQLAKGGSTPIAVAIYVK